MRRASGNILDGTTAAALRSAVRWAIRVLTKSIPDRPEEIRARVLAVARAVATGSDLSPPDNQPGTEIALERRIVDLFSAGLLAYWKQADTPPSSQEMLALLGSLERVRKSLEPRAADDFAAVLATAHGPGLIVELAHDLRSPLTSILFLSETLRRGQSGEINEIQRRQLGIIYSAALGLVSMASDVMELARGGEHSLESRPSPFSIREILESICNLVGPMAEEKGVSVRVRSAAFDLRLGFPVALSRVLLNLTTNALKFTDRGFVEIITRSTGPERVEFAVRDTGRGIEPEDARHLFAPLHRRSSGGRYGFSGSGLGLAISRKLVEAMGSELQYESTVGWGTRFFFELSLPSAPPPD